ncbi:MAG TPA: winged helix-turn-helix domain-containing protein, partial [Pyrinomonadaceae bacterium]|nr:winged helix-turn-helix domain-containing protein [Pyrinomonadaceae bacterium]
MDQQDNHSYEFGRFRLKVAERVLLREGELVPLTPKVFDILATLVEHGGQVVSKDDLMKRVWPNTFVEEGNLTQNISLLRKALGETPGGVQFIETVPRRGYRFVAEMSRASSGNGNGDLTVSTPSLEPVVSIPNTTSQSAGIKRTPIFAVVAGLVVVGIIAAVYFTSSGKSGGATPIQSIAVLPFVDESADPDAEYINDKIVESLINSLSKLPQLRVVPRSVVAGYRSKELDPRKVAQELNVRAIVTGRMRRHGDIISIQADLIDLDNVAQLWGQHYDHKLADVLLVQDDISRDIFENLRLKLNVEEKKQLEAYGLYLKGRNAWNKRTGDALQQAIDYFNQA